MTKKEFKMCSGIIHCASAAAGAIGSGFAKESDSDNKFIIVIQLAMAVSLGAVFGVTLDQSKAKALVASAIAGTVGKTVSQVMISRMPNAGNVINAVTAASVTEAIG